MIEDRLVLVSDWRKTGAGLVSVGLVSVLDDVKREQRSSGNLLGDLENLLGDFFVVLRYLPDRLLQLRSENVLPEVRLPYFHGIFNAL